MNDPLGNPLSAATLAVIEALEALQVPYLVGGSLASTLHGVARTTIDSDLVADLHPQHIAPFVRLLQNEFYLSVPAIVEALQTHGSFNLIHLASAHKVDIFLPKARLFDQAQMARSTAVPIPASSPRSILFASPEDTILAKLEWFRLGGEQSERQWRDVAGIVATQGDTLDWAYMDEMGATMGVADLVARLHSA